MDTKVKYLKTTRNNKKKLNLQIRGRKSVPEQTLRSLRPASFTPLIPQEHLNGFVADSTLGTASSTSIDHLLRHREQTNF